MARFKKRRFPYTSFYRWLFDQRYDNEFLARRYIGLDSNDSFRTKIFFKSHPLDRVLNRIRYGWD